MAGVSDALKNIAHCAESGGVHGWCWRSDNSLSKIHQRFNEILSRDGTRTPGKMRMVAANASALLDIEKRYDLVVVDEVQDVPVPVLQMSVNLARGALKDRNVMLVGDAGQAIYQSGPVGLTSGSVSGGGNVYTLGQSERSTAEILEFGSSILQHAVDAASDSLTNHRNRCQASHSPRFLHDGPTSGLDRGRHCAT